MPRVFLGWCDFGTYNPGKTNGFNFDLDTNWHVFDLTVLLLSYRSTRMAHNLAAQSTSTT